MPLRRLSATLCLALPMPGCIEPPPAVSSVDLAERLPVAQVWREQPRLLPAQAEASESLAGFAPPQGDMESRWSLGESSRIDLFLVAPRRLRLRLRGHPLRAPGAPPQVVTIRINGETVDRWTMTGGLETREVTVASRFWRTGRNAVGLHYEYTLRPADVLPDNPDRRDLAVRWRSIELVDVEEPDPRLPRTGPNGGGLVLGAGSRVDFFVELPRDPSIELEGARPWRPSAAGADARLEIEVRSLAGAPPARFAVPVAGATAKHRFRVPEHLEGPARLSVAMHPEGAAGVRVGGLRLTGKVPRTVRATVTRRPRGERPNVIVYLVDTLRADHLGTYGYARPTSPHLDRLAAQGVVFESVIAQSSWTRPAVASLLTGLQPQVHGANGREDALSPQLPRLPAVLRDAGYQTAAFFTNGNAGPDFGFDEGFDAVAYLNERRDDRIHAMAEEVNQEAFGWLDSRDRERPFLLWIHVSDPHAPYHPPEPFRSRFGAGHLPPEAGSMKQLRRSEKEGGLVTPIADLIDLYDGEIASVDHALGRLLARLEADAVLEETIVVVVADHGEAFQEHGRWEHGNDLHQEQIHVPLVLRLPRARLSGLRIPDPVQQVDLLPTLLELLGLPAPPDLQGRSLVPLLEGAAEAPHPAFSYLAKDGLELWAVLARRHKLIRYGRFPPPRPPRQLFDLLADPEERIDRWEEGEVAAGYLESLLRRSDLEWSARAPRVRGNPDDELADRLKALGYLQ